MSGELAGGDRAAHVQGLGGPAGFEGFGSAGQGGVEVQGIGEVELALDPAGALEGDLVVVDGDVPPLGSLLRILRGLARACTGRWPRRPAAPGPRCRSCGRTRPPGRPRTEPPPSMSPLVAWATRRARQTGRCTGLGAVPEPGEPVLQLHRVRDQHPSGVGGTPDRGGELGDAELRDQRCPRPGQRQTGVPATGHPGRGEVGRLRRVLLGPGHRRIQHVGLGPVSRGTPVAREPEHRGSGVEVGPGRRHT